MDPAASHAADLICGSAKTLAAGTVERQIAAHPETTAEWGADEHSLREDTIVRFGYLAEAVGTQRSALFSGQLAWLKILCAARGVGPDPIRANIEAMADEVADRMPDSVADLTRTIVTESLQEFDTAPEEVASYLAAEHPHVDLARRVLLAIFETRERDALGLIEKAFDEGATVRDLIQHVIVPVQQEMGRMWQMAEATIAEEHYCTNVLYSALAILRNKAKPQTDPAKRALLAAVSSETHDLGVRLVATELELSGWQTIYLGASTPASAIIEAVRDFGCNLIGLSANLVLYVRPAAHTIAALRAHPETSGIPILIGGQPFQAVPDLWEIVGADATARTLAECGPVASNLIGLRQTG